MTEAEDLQQLLDDALNSKPETGAQWAEIAWLEAELIRAREQEAEDNGQFGVGA